MTLNGLFALNFCLGIGMPWVCLFWLSGKPVEKFAKLRMHTLSAAEMYYRDSNFWRYKFKAVTHRVSLKRECQTGELYSHITAVASAVY